ncbi:hypothetical protein HV824_15845 [Myxococcus sp. AM009]|uniref:hypothetical protein n=1 Tax=unclassified Myxococcus TaxID=2648731 RepID=UPI001596239C|nr:MULTISPECIES: hypothetical protein [unclassified Myxococcus]NVI99585.1 hypothetical protein [Myxococcus sp. AM009]NVJ17085.1 hypothetical protein [Myxococcus sp. AM010]
MRVRHVAIGASHEVYASGEAALAAAVTRRVGDRLARERQARLPPRYRRWRVLETTPLLRSMEGGLDDTKFLYPVLDNLPLIVFPLLAHALTGGQVSVHGPREVCHVVEVVRDFLLEEGHIDERSRVVAVQEDLGDISLFRSLQRSTEGLSASAEAPLLWSAGDLVLAYNAYPWLRDRHLASHALILNLNARQVVFPPSRAELFARNYLDRMRLDDGKETLVDVKEPNLLLFTGAGLQGLAKVDGLRKPPPGETYMKVLLRGVGRVGCHAPLRATLAFLRYGLKRVKDRLDDAEGVSQRHVTALASAFFGVPTVVKAENTDPFSVRDGDSLEDVFGYYRAFLQPIVDSRPTKEAGYRELAHYHPHAELLYRLSLRLRPLQAELPLWRQWPELIRDKCASLNQRLVAEFRGLGLADATPLVPEYFDATGTFRCHPLPSDDLRATGAFLRQVYLPAYERDRASAPGPRGARLRLARRRVAG